jgi:hypothetical protein
MMVLNIAIHGDWLRLTEGDDDRHLDGRARDLNEIFLTPRRHVAPCCEGEIRNIAKQQSRDSPASEGGAHSPDPLAHAVYLLRHASGVSTGPYVVAANTDDISAETPIEPAS